MGGANVVPDCPIQAAQLVLRRIIGDNARLRRHAPLTSVTPMTFFDVVLTTRASLHPEMEPDEFISSYHGVIRAEGEDGVLHRVGRVHA